MIFSYFASAASFRGLHSERIEFKRERLNYPFFVRMLRLSGALSATRYASTFIEFQNLEIIGTNLTAAQAFGIEQLIIELNNKGLPFPAKSKTLDNKLNATSPQSPTYVPWKIEGKRWLLINAPLWQIKYYRPNTQENNRANQNTNDNNGG